MRSLDARAFLTTRDLRPDSSQAMPSVQLHPHLARRCCCGRSRLRFLSLLRFGWACGCCQLGLAGFLRFPRARLSLLLFIGSRSRVFVRRWSRRFFHRLLLWPLLPTKQLSTRATEHISCTLGSFAGGRRLFLWRRSLLFFRRWLPTPTTRCHCESLKSHKSELILPSSLLDHKGFDL